MFVQKYISHVRYINPYNAEIFLYKPRRPEGFSQFEIIINVLASSSRYVMGLRPLLIWINSFSAQITSEVAARAERVNACGRLVQ